ncbi:hypothetical protein OUZ56_022352 [Daphnia magna]|uniref:Uncharacterized protein n=1 Tax=Daphnia magna TaxID=35525 RepID=A0ABR0AWE7_9CRUS|nr:hypothetical protein OUZ56_022352 [Daphnia magna]
MNLSQDVMLEFNCSRYDFDSDPPDVSQHFDAFGIIGLGIAYGGTASSGLLTLLFFIQICSNVRKCPWEWQRSLSWIVSMPMIISWLSLTSFLVPRAGNLCSIVKQSYMPFMLMHFLDLALMIDGDEEQILNTLMDNRVPMSLCASPCCFFGICCRSSIVTRRGFRAMRRRVYQAPLWQFLLTMAAVVLEIAEINQFLPEYIVMPLFQTLAGLNVLMCMLGNWGFNVIVKTFKGLERSNWNRRMKKAHALTLFIAIMKLQFFVLGLLVDYTDYIPCSPPAVSPVHMKQNMDALLTLAEALLFGLVFTFVYRVRQCDIDRAIKGDGAERSPNFFLIPNMQTH